MTISEVFEATYAKFGLFLMQRQWTRMFRPIQPIFKLSTFDLSFRDLNMKA